MKNCNNTDCPCGGFAPEQDAQQVKSCKTILDEAKDIVYTKREERNYGDFSSSMVKVAQMASIMSGKNLDAKDAFNILIAIKFVRQSTEHKRDNLVDACGYIAGLSDYIVKESEVKEALENIIKSNNPEKNDK